MANTSPKISDETEIAIDSDSGGDALASSSTTGTADLPLTVYSPTAAIRQPVRLLSDIARGFYKGRELAWRLFVRNLRGMYRQTLLGLFWAFLPPIANTAIWIFLQSQNVFSMGDTGVNSTVYILAGMILWQAFIDAFQAPMGLLKANRNMISKLNFPRESLLMVGFGEVLFNLAIRILLLIPAFFWFGVPLSFGMLAAVPAIACMIMLGMALGLLIMPLGSLYQDVGRFIAMFVPFWMIITPIIYVPPTNYPGTLLNWVNPASPLLIFSRDLLLTGTSTHASLGLLFGLASIPLIVLGLIVYRVSLPHLIERMPA